MEGIKVKVKMSGTKKEDGKEPVTFGNISKDEVKKETKKD